MKGVVYTLNNCSTGEVFYVGSTTQDLSQRVGSHIAATKTELIPVYEHIRINNILFEIEEIETIEINKKSELQNVESYWIEQFRQWGFALKNIKFNLSPPKITQYSVQPISTSRGIRMAKRIWAAMDKLAELAELDKRKTSQYIILRLEEIAEANKSKFKK